MSRFPFTRPRRLRQSPFIRDLVRQTTLSISDLIYPVFVVDSASGEADIKAMPGIRRWSEDSLPRHVENAVQAGIPAIALFPVIDNTLKTSDGREAANPNGLVPRVVKRLKREFPGLGIITDVALDPYTSHGQDGIIDSSGYILNDVTVDALRKQAMVQAEAGSDIVAPSDMMDGRVGSIREALEERGFTNTMILSYAAKYASSFYAPFRDAVGSAAALGKSDKKTYQMDPGNSDEALREVAADIDEGADIVMVKPGLAYLDIIRRVKDRFNIPVFAYNVSGEYAMIKAAALAGYVDERAAVSELLLSFKRAGADAILTYHALEVAKDLQGNKSVR
jgi:porphobilinogen synthase